MRSQGWPIAIVALAVWAGALRAGRAQDDGARLEAEARGQAAEADRRFKEKDFAGALPLYQAERASRAALGDLRYEAYAARATGCCLAELGEYGAAVEAWNDARRLDANREDPGFEGYDCLLIGNVEAGLNRLREAETALGQALPLLVRGKDAEHESDARRLMGRVLTLTGRAADSAPHFERARALAAGRNDARGLADVAADRGLAALVLGEPGRAYACWNEARRGFEALDLPAAVALMDRQLGDALLALGLPEAAAARVEQAAAARERLDDPAKLADDLEFLAELAAAADRFPRAVALARRAVAAHRAAGDAENEREALVALAHYQSLAGDWKPSAATLADALKLVRRDGEPDDQVRLLILAAGVEQRAGAADRARALLDEAERAAKESNDEDLVESVAGARRDTAEPAPPAR